MTDGVDASMEAMKVPASNPPIDRAPVRHVQQLPPRDDTVLTLSQIRNPSVEVIERISSKAVFFIIALENSAFVRHAADGGGRRRTWDASKVTFAQQKRLQPAVAASGFDPFK